MRERVKHAGKIFLWTLSGILMIMFVLGRPSQVLASEKAEAQSIVDKATGTLTDLMNDEHFPWLHASLKTARGVVIFPQILKAGYILGGSGGTGILLVRNEANGTWSDPAFYTLGSVTFGLQIGAEAAEVIMVAVNQKAIDSLFSSSVKLGGDVSVAVGPIGGGAKGSMTIPEITADFVSFAKTKGLYGGLNFEGAVMNVRNDLNISYYGKDVSPKDILMRRTVSASGAHELRSALQKASAR
jgi:lipid-binding SYLF domain-containing protein